MQFAIGGRGPNIDPGAVIAPTAVVRASPEV
jgi:hypothetical protein